MVLIIILLIVGVSSAELLTNGDLENGNFNGNWECNQCSLTHSHDSHSGQYSGQVTNRKHNWAGISQNFQAQGNQRVVFKAFIKLLNHAPGHAYHQVQVMFAYSAHGHNQYHMPGKNFMVQKEFGWVEIGFDVIIPHGATNTRIYIQIHEPEVNYLFDTASLTILPDDTNWKTEANTRIPKIRKSDINIRVHNNGHGTQGYNIELKQMKNAFAFGCAFNADAIVGAGYKAYQDFFYNNFEWAVPENALKWRLLEWTKDHTNYDKPMNAINALLAKGIKVRGHNMFWAVDSHCPAWLNGMSSGQLIQEMHSHNNEMISHTRGKLLHWDVNNENLHGDYYERHTGHPNITMDMFRWLHEAEPEVKLFLNEYNVLSNSQCTTAYANQAKLFKAAGVPIYGAGLQSHFGSSNIDMTSLKYRIDKISESGVRLWITELTVKEADENRKASALEDVMTLFFSHPSIDGVLLWDFWDQKTFDKDTAIATGNDVHPNAAGLKWQHLRQSWTTHVTHSLTKNSHVSGFKGDYVMNIKHNGHVIETKQFTLDGTKTIDVTFHGSTTSTTIH